ncbi:DUF2877 domain-containing protein [Buttiauxella noackiae]|uniref:DUF2877 domain-containing protein n=1 Tax=Buttiauxella noackiae TaxID=82992 RepID=UPI002357DFD3|nr:DUF2877 domain-containing protein [Buttiauxella noackiae]MCA1921780.1 DUF2877 domain-containing protein [Buttiauxella noackiae]
MNIQLPARQQIFTLLSTDCDNAPNSCRLAVEHCPNHFKPGERVSFHSNGIDIGTDKRIDFSRCTRWEPEALFLSHTRIKQTDWQNLAQMTQASVIQSSSLFYFHGDNIFYQEMSRLLQLHRKQLISALNKGNCAAIENEISGLLGLGIGLTPSGDDYLAGLSAVLFIAGHPARKYREVFISVLEREKHKTTQLSAITLREAIDQRYRETIYGFINQVVNGDLDNIQRSINEIKKIGSSSGCDMLCGMADAFFLTRNNGGNYVDQDCD